MKRKVLLIMMALSMVFISCCAHAEDNFLGGIGGTEFFEEEDLAAVSHDEAAAPEFKANNKIAYVPTLPSHVLLSNRSINGASTNNQLQSNTLGNSASSISGNLNRISTPVLYSLAINNTTPNTAPEFPLNVYYSDTLDAQGQQAWFYIQAPANNQITVHLDTINNASVDYDLYVFRYDSGSLYTFKESLRGPQADEHISFATNSTSNPAGIYFILVTSYTGYSTSPYTLHVDAVSGYENPIDDFPETATNITPNTPAVWDVISSPCDEDFYKFTVSNTTHTFINLEQMMYGEPNQNVPIKMTLYRLGGSELFYQGEYTVEGQDLDGDGYEDPGRNRFIDIAEPLMAGTYYLHIQQITNTAFSNAITYGICLNAYNSVGNVAIVLGRNIANNKIAYVTNAGELRVNGYGIKSGFAGATFSRTVNNSTWKCSTTISAVTSIVRAKFGHFSSNCTNNYTNALAIQANYCSVYYDVHAKYTPQDPWVLLGTNRFNFRANTTGVDTWFILDLDNNGELVDCQSSNNVFYNTTPNFGGGYFCSFTAD